ncbi:MAG: exosortase/archaeosortase family protein [Phycisphaerae bacterium]
MADSHTVVMQRTAWTAARMLLALLVGLLAVLVWAYWSTLVLLHRDWGNDDNYSVGQLVPFAVLYLLWHDRERLGQCRIKACWWGVGVILVAQAARLFGLIQLFESAERYAFVLSIVGVVLLVAGWEVFWKSKWILLFLFLMLPLPGRIHNLISSPLQSNATNGAVFSLELLGVVVSNDGNVIVLNDTKELAVAEACSGLRMLTAFVIVAATLAYVVNRPQWQKVVLVASSIPIAIMCNVARLVATAFLFLMANNDELAERFFHDFAGLTMMPIAVAILMCELWVMARLVIQDEPQSEYPGTSARTEQT